MFTINYSQDGNVMMTNISIKSPAEDEMVTRF